MALRAHRAYPRGTVELDDLRQDAVVAWLEHRARRPEDNTDEATPDRIRGALIDGAIRQLPLTRAGCRQLVAARESGRGPLTAPELTFHLEQVTRATVAPSPPDPEEALGRRERRASLRAAIQRLGTSDRELLIALHGLDGSEPRGGPALARANGTSRQTIHRRHQRALAALRRELRQIGLTS